MSCVSPCSTCTVANFYSCTTCNSSVLPNSTQYGTQCLIDPTWYIQLAGTCMLFIFIMFPLLRKSSMVLTKIFDIIQMVAYFKYIVGFIYYRHNYLYLDMRAMNPWNEGWKLLTASNDATIPIFLTQETFVNKLIRIASIWCGMIVLILIIGIIKSMCGDNKMQFSTFMSKNIGNTLAIAFNITIQDISFYCAAVFYSFSLSGMMNIIFFAIAVLLSFAVLAMLIWQFAVINYLYDKSKEDSLYNYQQMFLYRMDYDLFQTYSLTNLPEHEKKIHRYSNLVMLELVKKKIGYAFLIVSYLYKSNVSYTQQVYQLLGFIVFFQLVWYIAMPFDPSSQLSQLIINIIADSLLIAILVMPLLFNSSGYDLIYMILCLTLFGLAVISGLLELFLDLYTFIPYDLYDIGLTIVIEDKQLLKQLQRRKKQQQQNEKKIQQLKDEQERLRQQILENKTTTIIHKKTSTVHHITKHIREHDSQESLDKRDIKDAANLDYENVDPNRFVYHAQDIEDPNDELSKYRIDITKKRKIYEFDKKKPFVYSNKVDS